MLGIVLLILTAIHRAKAWTDDKELGEEELYPDAVKKILHLFMDDQDKRMGCYILSFLTLFLSSIVAWLVWPFISAFVLIYGFLYIIRDYKRLNKRVSKLAPSE